MKVTFCEHNPHKSEVIDMLKANHPEVEIAIEECISNCGVCSSMPIATVDGRPLVGDDIADLLNKINSLL